MCRHPKFYAIRSGVYTETPCSLINKNKDCDEYLPGEAFEDPGYVFWITLVILTLIFVLI